MGTLRAAALTAVLLIAGAAGAQPPGGGPSDTKKEPSKDAPKKDATAAKADPNVDAWVKVLGEKMTDRHDAIRDSARAALVAMGPSALPALKKLADSDDGATATAATKVIERIEHHARPPMPGGPRMAGRFGGMAGGPGGFGGPNGSGPGNWNQPGGPGNPPGPGGPGGPPRGFGGGTGGFPGGAGGFGGGAGGPGGFGEGGARFGGGGSAGPGPMIERMAKELNLSDKQKDKVKAILEGHQKKMRETIDKARGGKERPDIDALRAEMKKQHESLLKELKPILNEEQNKKAQQLLDRPMGGIGGGFGGAGAGGRGGPRRPDRDE